MHIYRWAVDPQLYDLLTKKTVRSTNVILTVFGLCYRAERYTQLKRIRLRLLGANWPKLLASRYLLNQHLLNRFRLPCFPEPL